MIKIKGQYNEAIIYTNTIDESPFVYKPMESIIENIKDTVDIIEIVTPCQ